MFASDRFQTKNHSARMFVREMMRDDAANDNMSTADRKAMMAWAQERMNKPAWRQFAITAMVQAQV